jgi:plasmid stability protein
MIPMSSITIRNLDPAVKERLRVRAAQQGHSMEAEARDIISSVVGAEPARQRRQHVSRWVKGAGWVGACAAEVDLGAVPTAARSHSASPPIAGAGRSGE